MSIVKGASGRLQYSGSLITSNDHTVMVWMKAVDTTTASWVFYYNNTASNYLAINKRNVNSSVRYMAAQTSSANAELTSSIVPNTWQAVTGYMTSSRPYIRVDGTDSGQGSFAGAFVAEASPTLNIFTDEGGGSPVEDNFKISAICIWNSVLSAGDITSLEGGADPSTIAAANIVEIWREDQGVVKDGSDNLTTWTGVNGTVLTPSGTVTVDDADTAPYVVVGASISDVDTDNILTDGQTSVVANISGFTTPPDSGKLVSGAFEYALTNLSSNATTATFDIQDVANLSGSQAGVPFSSASHSLTLVLENSVDVESASIAITLNPATGRAVQELTGVNNAADACVTKNFTGTPPNTSQIEYYTNPEQTTPNSLNAQAQLTSDIINGTINMRYWDAVTGLWEPFTVTLVNGVITSYSVPRMIARSKRLTNVIKRIQNAQEI